MTALDLFYYEYGKSALCPLTKLPPNCPKDYGYLADAEWCSVGANNEDCAKCWAREVQDPFIAAALPNYTPVDERKGYCDLGAFRLVIEDGNAVGVYCPGGLECDTATVMEASRFIDAICKTAEKFNIGVAAVIEAILGAVGFLPSGEDVG